MRIDDFSEPVILPGNIEAEQAVLGSGLANNGVIEQCPWLSGEDFLEPVHGRIWSACQEALRDGERADPIMLRRMFDADPALRELDGSAYLSRMAMAAAPIRTAVDYARLVRRLSRLRQVHAIGAEMCTHALAPDREDAASIVAGLRSRLDALCVDETKPSAKHISVVIDSLADEIEHPKPVWQIGIPALDTSFGGGLPQGYVVGIEARMKVGKSLIAHTILLSLARQRVPAAFLALEMGSARLAQRMVAQVGRFNSGMFRHAGLALAARVAEARPMLDKLPMWFVDHPGMRFAELKATANQLMQVHGILVFVLDYWQLVRPDGRCTNRAEFLAEVAQWCADHAHEHGTTWIITSQENRTGESYGGDGLAKACDWLAVAHKHEQQLIHGRFGTVETLWLDVKFARDGTGSSIGTESSPVLYIDPNGPHLSQLDL